MKTSGAVRALLSTLAASGDLHSDSQMFFKGDPLLPDGDAEVSGGVSSNWDGQDVSVDITPIGGRRIRQVEELRSELVSEGRSDLASRLPEFFFVPAYAMESLRDAEKYIDQYPGLNFDALKNIQMNVSMVTFQAMGSPNVGLAFDFAGEDGRERIPNYRTVELNALLEAKKTGKSIGEIVGSIYRDTVDRWKNPSEHRFSPSA